MKKKILLIFIIIVLAIISYFLIRNRILENVTTENSVLKFILDDFTTGSNVNKTYYITENKEYAIIEISGYSEKTGNSINTTEIKKIKNSTIEKYIQKLEEYIELNPLNDVDILKIGYPQYKITYKGEDIIVPKNLDKEFFKETEELLNNIY